MPNITMRFLAFTPTDCALLAKYAKKPGYNGKTHTAPRGANKNAPNQANQLITRLVKTETT